MPLANELERIQQEIQSINTQAASLVAGLSEPELAWRPHPGAWSLAENLVHLHITTQTFLPTIDRAIEDAKHRDIRGQGPFSLGFMGKLYVWYVEPPAKIRLPAPKILRPLLTGPAGDALPQFLQSQQLMTDRVAEANGLDLGKVSVASPLASFVRMNLLAFFSVFTGHERRHIVQASKVREKIRHAADS